MFSCCVSALCNCSQNMAHFLITYSFPTLSLPLHQWHNPAMGKCRYCGKPVTGSLRKHLSRCVLKTFARKFSPPPHRGKCTFSKGTVHLQISTKHMTSSQLAGDTYFATHTRPSKLLQSRPSLRERAKLLSSLPVSASTQSQTTFTLQGRSLRHWHRV